MQNRTCSSSEVLSASSDGHFTAALEFRTSRRDDGDRDEAASQEADGVAGEVGGERGEGLWRQRRSAVLRTARNAS